MITTQTSSSSPLCTFSAQFPSVNRSTPSASSLASRSARSAAVSAPRYARLTAAMRPVCAGVEVGAGAVESREMVAVFVERMEGREEGEETHRERWRAQMYRETCGDVDE
jgi:hypothetical protein